MSDDEYIPILGRADADGPFHQARAMYGAPAFVRRARRVEEGWAELLERCSRQREEWLVMPRLRIGLLQALAGDWQRVCPLLADGAQITILEQHYDILSPRLRSHVTPCRTLRQLRAALADLCASLTVFNRHWAHFVEQLDLGPVNTLRADYNRWYILEKECAVRSPRIATEGFTGLAPLASADVMAAMPLLPLPVLSSA